MVVSVEEHLLISLNDIQDDPRYNHRISNSKVLKNIPVNLQMTDCFSFPRTLANISALTASNSGIIVPKLRSTTPWGWEDFTMSKNSFVSGDGFL